MNDIDEKYPRNSDIDYDDKIYNSIGKALKHMEESEDETLGLNSVNFEDDDITLASLESLTDEELSYEQKKELRRRASELRAKFEDKIERAKKDIDRLSRMENPDQDKITKRVLFLKRIKDKAMSAEDIEALAECVSISLNEELERERNPATPTAAMLRIVVKYARNLLASMDKSQNLTVEDLYSASESFRDDINGRMMELVRSMDDSLRGNKVEMIAALKSKKSDILEYGAAFIGDKIGEKIASSYFTDRPGFKEQFEKLSSFLEKNVKDLERKNIIIQNIFDKIETRIREYDGDEVADSFKQAVEAIKQGIDPKEQPIDIYREDIFTGGFKPKGSKKTMSKSKVGFAPVGMASGEDGGKTMGAVPPEAMERSDGIGLPMAPEPDDENPRRNAQRLSAIDNGSSVCDYNKITTIISKKTGVNGANITSPLREQEEQSSEDVLPVSLNDQRVQAISQVLEIVNDERYDDVRSIEDFQSLMSITDENPRLYQKAISYAKRINRIYLREILYLYSEDRNNTNLPYFEIRSIIANLRSAMSMSDSPFMYSPSQIDRRIMDYGGDDCGFSYILQLYKYAVPFRIGSAANAPASALKKILEDEGVKEDLSSQISEKIAAAPKEEEENRVYISDKSVSEILQSIEPQEQSKTPRVDALKAFNATAELAAGGEDAARTEALVGLRDKFKTSKIKERISSLLVKAMKLDSGAAQGIFGNLDNPSLRNDIEDMVLERVLEFMEIENYDPDEFERITDNQIVDIINELQANSQEEPEEVEQPTIRQEI